MWVGGWVGIFSSIGLGQVEQSTTRAAHTQTAYLIISIPMLFLIGADHFCYMMLPLFIVLLFCVLLPISDCVVITTNPPALALQTALNTAIRSRQPSFRIPGPMEYVFGSRPFLIAHARSMQIQADPGVTLWFSIGAGVRFEGCTDVTFNGNGLKVDYNPPPFFQATVLEIESVRGHAFSATIRPDVGFLDPITFWDKYSNDPANEFVQGPQWWDGSEAGSFQLYSQSFQQFNATAQVQACFVGSGQVHRRPACPSHAAAYVQSVVHCAFQTTVWGLCSCPGDVLLAAKAQGVCRKEALRPSVVRSTFRCLVSWTLRHGMASLYPDFTVLVVFWRVTRTQVARPERALLRTKGFCGASGDATAGCLNL